MKKFVYVFGVLFAAAHLRGSEYLVIDVSAGPNAAQYGVAYHDTMPVAAWTAEYKKTKIVLRRCAKGDCTAGGFSLTRDFYAGVFEITQKQWE